MSTHSKGRHCIHTCLYCIWGRKNFESDKIFTTLEILKHWKFITGDMALFYVEFRSTSLLKHVEERKKIFVTDCSYNFVLHINDIINILGIWEILARVKHLWTLLDSGSTFSTPSHPQKSLYNVFYRFILAMLHSKWFISNEV